ncbi:MAG: hypothetical protein QW193_02470, partial [Nitrososphaerales archaeon]
KDSGNKCRKAPPSNAPEAKATNTKRILLSILSFNDKKTIPIREHKLTNNVAKKISKRTDI